MNFDNDAERKAIRDLVATLYRAISGPAGAPRTWDELKACYVTEASITPFHLEPGGEITFEFLTPLSYIASREPLFAANGFYETEVNHVATIVGRIAHVFSWYEARRAPEEAAFASGVNSIQLVRLAEGWKVIAITWQFTGVGAKDLTKQVKPEC